MKSNLISKSETSSLIKTVEKEWGVDIPKNKNLRVYHIADGAQMITGRGVKILDIDGTHVPFLSETDILAGFPSVTVDMGAVKFVCKGANLMRPGIKEYGTFEKDKLVCITEESQHKFLAVGRSLVSSEEMEGMQKGEVLRNLHYISDRFWEIGKTIRD